MRVALRGALRFTFHCFTADDLEFFWFLYFVGWLLGFVCFVFHDFGINLVVLRS